MKTIQINNLDFDLHDGPVGIAHSGGADSAIMLYVLMKYITGPIHVYTCANSLKQRVNPRIALDVIGKLLDITDRRDVYHHTFFTKRQTFNTLFDPLNEFVKAGHVNMMYTAGTALPPDSVLWDKTVFSSDNGLYDKRNPNIKKPVYNGATKQFYGPWWNMDKKFVKEVYDQFGMTEILYPITRSCEEPTLTSGHCGKCWWCEERIWAFGKL
jgi:7-cyano-7-deazaguanine synthase in queuosine biosynthesis